MRKRTTLIACAALLALPASASAHVFIEQESQPADAYPVLDVVIPHGCDGSATTSVTVRIPESVPTATPARHPLWNVTTKEGPKDEVELFGETITKGVSEVTWTATEPLPDDQLDVLQLEAKLPDTPGETVYFPAIQECERGETRWVQIPAEGQSPDDLEEPAPAVELIEPEEDASAGEEESDDGGDFASKGLGIAALIVGGLGLAAGGASLVRSRGA